MEALNRLIEKVGADKVIHLAFGGWILSKFYEKFGNSGLIPGLIVVFVMSVFKEYVLDKDSGADWNDVYAAMIGACLETLSDLFI